jgi:two-component system, OmpR family, flagellar system response regulator FtcR
MFFIIDDRPSVSAAQVSCFEREGIAAAAATVSEFGDWFGAVADEDISAIEGFLLGAGSHLKSITQCIRGRSKAPLIGVIDGRALAELLEFFAIGVDDVVVKPCHVREILARISAIGRRHKNADESIEVGSIRVFFDGREPLVGGAVLTLPRRERRILEYLVTSRTTRVTKTQIFNRVYGLFNEGIQESVIESHISRLRKRLRQRLGHDPIDSQRYLGYRLSESFGAAEPGHQEIQATSLVQGNAALMDSGAVSLEGMGHGTLRSYDDECVGYGCAG